MKSLIVIILALMSVSLINARKHIAAPLYGKKINVLGDSYVYNHKEPKENTWHAKIAEKYKMVYRNYGKNGNGIVTPKASGEPLVTRYKMMDKDAPPLSINQLCHVDGHHSGESIPRHD